MRWVLPLVLVVILVLVGGVGFLVGRQSTPESPPPVESATSPTSEVGDQMSASPGGGEALPVRVAPGMGASTHPPVERVTSAYQRLGTYRSPQREEAIRLSAELEEPQLPDLLENVVEDWISGQERRSDRRYAEGFRSTLETGQLEQYLDEQLPAVLAGTNAAEHLETLRTLVTEWVEDSQERLSQER